MTRFCRAMCLECECCRAASAEVERLDAVLADVAAADEANALAYPEPEPGEPDEDESALMRRAGLNLGRP